MVILIVLVLLISMILFRHCFVFCGCPDFALSSLDLSCFCPSCFAVVIYVYWLWYILKLYNSDFVQLHSMLNFNSNWGFVSLCVLGFGSMKNVSHFNW